MSKCNFKPYGDVEKRCLKCGYVIWVNEDKTDNEIVNDMIKLDYPKPNCFLNQ